MILNLFARIFVLFVFIGNVLPQSPCEDWEAYKDETCVNIFDTSPGLLSYDDASAYCASLTFNLMTVDTQEKQNFVENFLKSENVADNVWLGLKYSENGYEWLDSTPFHFANWGTGSPKNDSNYCVQIHMEEEEFGKWSEVVCSKKNLILCEKLQLWSYSKLQKSLMNVMKNPVPMGFIYVQLPKEKLPSEIWPWLRWEDVTLEYAGVFFRAEGGNSSSFGEIQEENCPRLVNVKYDHRNDDSASPAFATILDLYADNQQTKTIRTGVYIGGNYNSETGLNFRVSNGEVRPRNMAVRIWKRIE